MQIKIENLHYTYPESNFVLDIPELTFSPGLICLVGQNGSGKSTLLKLLADLLPAGKAISADGQVLADYLASGRLSKIAYAFQDPNDQLFNSSVEKELAWSMRQAKLPEAEIASRTEATLKEFGLAEFRDLNPYDLSLSGKKLLTIASALVLDPEVCLLDEPLMSLDYPGRCLVTQLIQKRVARGKTVIMITHDMDWLAEESQEVYAMSQGRLIYHGPVHQLFSDQEMLDRLGLLPAKTWQLSQLLGLKPELLTLK
ncbi:energy-coupling factor ABC transporter ATP-binding protein [Lactobacillus sp.]|uniref:energy-coupling factor ABC transporter ATP-binding protein n=1 Tax=Lactobacillus sp. TaxID=1591 RepID=UPI003F0D9CFD